MKNDINAKRFGWIRDLVEKPKFMVSQQNYETLASVAKTYESEYYAYFNLLLTSMPDGSKDKSFIADAKSDCLNIAKTIRIMINDLPGTVTNDEMLALPATMESVTTAISALQSSKAKSEELSAAITSVQEQYGISPEVMKQQNSQTYRKAAKAGDGSALKRVGRGIVEGSKGVLDVAASSLITSLLGPAAPLGKLAYGAGKGMFNLMMERKSSKAASPLARISNTISDMDLKSYYKKMQSGKNIDVQNIAESPRGRVQPAERRKDYVSPEDIDSVPINANYWSNQGRDPRDAVSISGQKYFVGGQQRPVAQPSKTYAGNSSSNLFEFFNVTAYKARWTREVLDELKKIARNNSTVIPDMSKAFSSLPKAVSGALIAASGIAGWQLGRMLGGVKIGDKTIDEHVTSAGEKVFEKTDQIGLGKASAGAGITGIAYDIVKKMNKPKLDPIAARANDIMKSNPGMLPKDAVAMARKESGLPNIQVADKKQYLDIDKLAKAIRDAMPKQQEIRMSSPSSVENRRDVRNSGDTLVESLNAGKLSIGDN